MRLSSIVFSFQQAAASIRRNGWMSTASAATMAICLIVLGIALLIVLNTNQLVATLESNVEIVAYVSEKADPAARQDLEERLKNLPGVAEVRFIPKEEALQELKTRFGEESNLVEALGGKNPLPDAYRLRMSRPEEVVPTAQELMSWAVFERVRYGQGVVEKLFALTRWIKIVSFTVMGFLALTAVFLIATTIHLTMNARQREIAIMKLVGATDWFIRWPFFLEGMFLGLIGAVLAVGVLSGSYLLLIKNVRLTLAFLPLVSDASVLLKVFGGLLVTGLVLGVAGTMVSIYRFLDV